MILFIEIKLDLSGVKKADFFGFRITDLIQVYDLLAVISIQFLSSHVFHVA